MRVIIINRTNLTAVAVIVAALFFIVLNAFLTRE